MSAEDSPRHSETMSSEEFPKYSEPTLASDAEMDEIVDLRPRNPPQESKGRVKTKPIMRVDAALLRSSGLMNRLPEFLGQLARANLETQTKLADRVEAVAFELDDETAAKQPHISLDIVTGLIESKSSDQGSRPSTSDSDGSSASGIQTPSSKKTKIVIKTSATKKRPTKIKLTVNGSSPSVPSSPERHSSTTSPTSPTAKRLPRIVVVSSRSASSNSPTSPTSPTLPLAPTPSKLADSTSSSSASSSSSPSTSRRPRIVIVNRGSSSSARSSPASPTEPVSPTESLASDLKRKIDAIDAVPDASSSTSSAPPASRPKRIKVVNRLQPWNSAKSDTSSD